MSAVEEVKQKLNIVDIVSEHVQLKKAGRHFKGLCPFHNEKTPSFIVSPDRQIFKCFGCGKGGSVIDFVMEYDHLEYIEALTDLAKRAGVTLERSAYETNKDKQKEELYKVNHLASEYYHFLLTKHALGEHARLYLGTRGVSEKVIESFGLGYSPNAWDSLLRFLKQKGYDEQILALAGLTVTSGRSAYDRFRGRLMFPLRDHRGHILGFSGRVLDPGAKEAKYINTSETPIYIKGNMLFGFDITKASIQKANEAIVVEGEFDVISSFQAGIGNVVAIKGSALTEGHVTLLRRYAERILFALDSDLAGDAAARRGIDIAEKAGLDMRVVVLPSGKDPDEAARENPVALKDAIAHAIPIYDYFLSSATKRYDKTTAFGKKKISDELVPILAKIENPIVQSHYVKKLSDTLDITDVSVMDAIRRSIRSVTVRRDTQPETQQYIPGADLSRVEKIEAYALALILQGNAVDCMESFHDELAIADVVHPAVRTILQKLHAYLADQTPTDFSEFIASLPPELNATVDQAFLWDIGTLPDDENAFRGEWYKTVRDLRREQLRRKITDLNMKLKNLDPAESDSIPIQKEIRDATERLKIIEKASGI